jgi:phosphonate transport system permease protein
VLEQHKARRRK